MAAEVPISDRARALLCQAVARARAAAERAGEKVIADGGMESEANHRRHRIFLEAMPADLRKAGLQNLAGGADWSTDGAWYLGDGEANQDPGGLYLLDDDGVWCFAQRYYVDDEYEGLPDELRDEADGGNDVIAVLAEMNDGELMALCSPRANTSEDLKEAAKKHIADDYDKLHKALHQASKKAKVLWGIASSRASIDPIAAADWLTFQAIDGGAVDDPYLWSLNFVQAVHPDAWTKACDDEYDESSPDMPAIGRAVREAFVEMWSQAGLISARKNVGAGQHARVGDTVTTPSGERGVVESIQYGQANVRVGRDLKSVALELVRSNPSSKNVVKVSQESVDALFKKTEAALGGSEDDEDEAALAKIAASVDREVLLEAVGQMGEDDDEFPTEEVWDHFLWLVHDYLGHHWPDSGSDPALLRGRTNPPKGMKVQSLVFDKGLFSASAAKAWAKRTGFLVAKVDTEANTLRIRQAAPSSFHKDTFKTITMTDGVQAVVGVPKA